MSLEVALGSRTRGARTMDAGAGTCGEVIVVADGMGGHCTGWLGARLAVRATLDAFGGEHPRFIGAAAELPDDWGWAGAMQSRACARAVYDACRADFGAAPLPRDLDALFAAIDRVIANISSHDRIHGVAAGSVAVTAHGARVTGAHAGIGRALVLRRRANEVESLVVEHYAHLVAARVSLAGAQGVDWATMPQQIVINALGCLGHAGVGVDQFDVELAPDDLLVLSSRRLDIRDDELAAVARQASERGDTLDDLARTIERLAADGDEELAFAIARSR